MKNKNMDGGKMSKKDKTENLPATEVLTPVEWPFKEYMQLPDDLNQLGQQMQWLLIQDARSHFMKGVIFDKVKNMAGDSVQTFGQFLRDYCGGMKRAAAYNYIRFARQCAELKAIHEFAEGNWSKVVTLMNRMTEEQLEDVNENGIDGKPLLEYSLVSARDFDKIIKELTGKLKTAEKSAETKFGIALEAYRTENENLKARLPQPDQRDQYAKKRLMEIAAASGHLSALMDEFAEDPHVVWSPTVKAAFLANAQGAHMRIEMFYEKYAQQLGVKFRPALPETEE